MTAEYFVPRTKTALVEWLRRYYPGAVQRFKRLRRDQLYAIYYRVISDIRRGKFPGMGE